MAKASTDTTGFNPLSIERAPFVLTGERGSFRHLTVAHGLSPSGYRARWNLKPTHPITAPAYTARRSALAKDAGLGLGLTRRKPAVAPVPSAPAVSDLDPTFVASLSASKRRRRPRRTGPAAPL